MFTRLLTIFSLLLTGVLRADDWHPVTVPGAWESTAHGYDGVAWYRTWLLPHDEFFTPHERNLFEESVSLTVPDVADAHEAFVNGGRVGGATGTVTTTPREASIGGGGGRGEPEPCYGAHSAGAGVA